MVEIDNIVNDDKNISEENGIEPEIKPSIEKTKKRRTPAQIAAFEKAIAKRKSNLAEKKKLKEEKIKPIETPEIPEKKISTNNMEFPKTQTGIDPFSVDLNAWISKDEEADDEEEEEEEEEESESEEEEEEEEESESEEEEIVYKKKPKVKKSKPIPIPKKRTRTIEKKKKPPKIVYETESESEEEEDPLRGLDFRSRSRLRGF